MGNTVQSVTSGLGDKVTDRTFSVLKVSYYYGPPLRNTFSPFLPLVGQSRMTFQIDIQIFRHFLTKDAVAVLCSSLVFGAYSLVRTVIVMSSSSIYFFWSIYYSLCIFWFISIFYIYFCSILIFLRSWLVAFLRKPTAFWRKKSWT